MSNIENIKIVAEREIVNNLQECPVCKYKWYCKSKMQRVRCSNCNKLFHNPYYYKK